MEQRLTLICLGVRDLGIARQFYENQFGWVPHPSSNDDIIFFQLRGMQLALYPRDLLAEDAEVDHAGSGFKGFSLAYNTRSENEVDEIFKVLSSRGVRVVKAPQRVPWGGYSGYIADPDENLWEIAFNPYLVPED